MHILKTTLAAAMLLFLSPSVRAQAPESPRLVIGIVVDQMRYDYLYRFAPKYGSGGFQRLLREGLSCENTHYNYVPTYTAPGHAAIYTGTTPAVNGIIGNEWWDVDWHKHRYVTADPRYETVGAPPGKVGRHSPQVMLTTTITDELRLGSNFRSKVVGVCLKDRGSILPAGHLANACYWFDDTTGNFITSRYYPDSLGLPQWVNEFNKRRLPEAYASKKWERLLPAEAYTESFAGWEKYKHGEYVNFPGDFPHDIPALKASMGNYGILRFTPSGNSLALDFALETLEKMDLGKDEFTDFLCLSFSSTDYVAHQFGIHAEETEDTYLRLDRDLARLFDYLDKNFGKGQVLVFLTADHGGGETPVHLMDVGVPSGVFPEGKLKGVLHAELAETLGVKANFIFEASSQQIWLNWGVIDSLGIEPDDVMAVIGDYLRRQPGIYDVFTRDELMALPDDYPFASEMRRGINPHRSGDLFFQLDPAWHPDEKFFGKGGATHGSSYAYDTHVPLLWYGWHIRPGTTHAAVNTVDIAPTLAALLHIMEPNGTTGKVIPAVVGEK